MRKSKNRYFYHINVSPGDAPGAITLNVVWMEREFDAYKLSRCMCSSNYYRFWVRYLWKSRHFIIPLAFDAPVRGFPSEYRHPLWDGKLKWCRYPMVKKFLYSFWRDPRTWQTDRRTDTGWQQRPHLHRIARFKISSHHVVCTFLSTELPLIFTKKLITLAIVSTIGEILSTQTKVCIYVHVVYIVYLRSMTFFVWCLTQSGVGDWGHPVRA